MSYNRIIHNDHNHIITHLVILFISTEQNAVAVAVASFVSHPLNAGVGYCFAMVKYIYVEHRVVVPSVHLARMIFPAFTVMFYLCHTIIAHVDIPHRSSKWEQAGEK